MLGWAAKNIYSMYRRGKEGILEAVIAGGDLISMWVATIK